MASAVHKNTETKAASVNVNSVCRQNTAEQGMAAPDEFMAEVQWSMAMRKMISSAVPGSWLHCTLALMASDHRRVFLFSSYLYFRYKLYTLVAEQTTIFSVYIFLRVNI